MEIFTFPVGSGMSIHQVQKILAVVQKQFSFIWEREREREREKKKIPTITNAQLLRREFPLIGSDGSKQAI